MGITKFIKKQSTGSADDLVQVFATNYPVNVKTNAIPYYEFNYPVYHVLGATYNYYNQTDYEVVSSDLDLRKNYTFVFSGNTSSFSGAVRLNHVLYKIKYDDFKNATINQSLSSYTQIVEKDLIEPIYVGTDVCSGSTSFVNNILGSTYTYTFPKIIKPEGQFSQNLFEDKSQFFIDTRIDFLKPIDQTLGDIQTISGSNIVQIKAYPDSLTEFVSGHLGGRIISGDTIFSGLSISGAFFTYIVPPKKPNLNVSDGYSTNSVSGTLSTFSPTFSFNGVDDGDYYILQVSYDTTDYNFEGDTVVEFPINKQNGNEDFVRTFSTPLEPESPFLYRILNVKELKDIFGIKRQTRIASNLYEAQTATDGNFQISGHTYLNYIGGTQLSAVTISLQAFNSTSSADISSDSKSDRSIPIRGRFKIDGSPTGSIYSTGSNELGVYDFGRIPGGTYLLTASPPPEYVDSLTNISQIISITSATNLDLVFSIYWGNRFITFNEPFTFL